MRGLCLHPFSEPRMGLSRQSRVPSKLDTYGFGSAQPLAGTEFGSLPDTAAMEVQIDLPQIEAQGVAIGNAVELHPLGRPDQHFTSTVSWVASATKTPGRECPMKCLSMRAPVPDEAVGRRCRCCSRPGSARWSGWVSVCIRRARPHNWIRSRRCGRSEYACRNTGAVRLKAAPATRVACVRRSRTRRPPARPMPARRRRGWRARRRRVALRRRGWTGRCLPR